MFAGRVVGNVWSTMKWPALNGLKLLLVQPFSVTPQGQLVETNGVGDEGVVVADTLDAGIGDTVIVAYGHAARVAIAPELSDTGLPPHPIDAAIVAIVDDIEIYDFEDSENA